MIRGTTPLLEFVLPFSTDLISEAWITLSQKKEVVLNKELSDCECEGTKITVKLSQTDTLKLQSGLVTEIQIRCRTTEDEALASDIISVDTARILKDGEI